MAASVEVTGDAYLCCLTHALSTEREEVMGLLLGEIKGSTVHVCTVCMMRRSDKQPDRVEISPEQLSSAAIQAEILSDKLQRCIQVVGWYHSHPHITVWPSHVDVRTQANYQLMGSKFIGLIFSCFHEIDKKCTTKVMCFQSIPKASDPSNYEYRELPVKIVPSLYSTVSPMCVSALIHLMNILLEEEKETYTINNNDCSDEFTLLHNGAVYIQSLTSLLQVIGSPLLQLLHELIQHNKLIISQLKKEKERLQLSLDTEGESV